MVAIPCGVIHKAEFLIINLNIEPRLVTETEEKT